MGFVGVVFLLTLILRPPSEVPPNTDAVVVFAGGEGERLPAALDLIEREQISNLLISTGVGDGPGAQERRDLCRTGIDGVEVVCFEPSPDDTAGEAAEFGRIASANRLTNVVVVTSSYHVARAAMRLEQCFAGEVGAYPAVADRTFLNISHELLGLIELSLWDRSCNR